MSPARARTSRTDIVAVGRELLEAGGLDAVTMQAVADRVGIRAPSLYKRFSGRGDLIAAVGASILADLRDELAPFVSLEPAAGIRSIAEAFRQFALGHPRSYELIFLNLPPGSRPPAELNAKASAPLVELAGRLAGPDQALEAARLVTAFAHGFVSMELSGAFRLGGDVDAAYRYGVDVLVDALANGKGSLRAAEPPKPGRPPGTRERVPRRDLG
jgi:AcrR family transcriptional regulator